MTSARPLSLSKLNLHPSKLWTRRMTNHRSHDLPVLSPLYGKALAPILHYHTGTDCTSPSRPWPSSPSLYTPTEAIGILLGQSPTEAAQTSREAIEAATSGLRVIGPLYRHYCYSSPCSPALDSSHLPDMVSGEEWSEYLLRSLSEHEETFKMEIDMATLATEVALRVLTSSEGKIHRDSLTGSNKMRLLPQGQGGLVGLPTPATDDGCAAGELITQQIASPESVSDRSPRKGRARMSQEKRKRLARRKEREAMMLGMPSKPVSAPPYLTHFALQSAARQETTSSPWWQERGPYQQQREAKQQHHRSSLRSHIDQMSKQLSFGGMEDSSVSAPPSLVVSEGSPSTTFTQSPLPSPVMTRRATCPVLDDNNKSSKPSFDTMIPRLALHPPSPQQARTTTNHYQRQLKTSPISPPFHSHPSPAFAPRSATSSSAMRWSTASGFTPDGEGANHRGYVSLSS